MQFPLLPSRETPGQVRVGVLVSGCLLAMSQGVKMNPPLQLGAKRRRLKHLLLCLVSPSVMCRQYLLNSREFFKEKYMKMVRHSIAMATGAIELWVDGVKSK